jgi:hypothetical protein
MPQAVRLKIIERPKTIEKPLIIMGVIRPCRRTDLDPKRPGHRVCLYDKAGKKLLGRHKTPASALRQERAIQVRKRA